MRNFNYLCSVKLQNSYAKDFKDVIQYYTAIENKINIIITRNLKDFKNAKIPVLTAKEYTKLKKQLLDNRVVDFD